MILEKVIQWKPYPGRPKESSFGVGLCWQDAGIRKVRSVSQDVDDELKITDWVSFPIILEVLTRTIFSALNFKT